VSSLDARCALTSRDAGEPLHASAPRARAWLILEQPGPYGFAALSDSHLPERLREALGALPKDTGTTVLLARSVGHHADHHEPVARRRFWFAHTSPGGVRMRRGEIDDATLLGADLLAVTTAAARGELPPWGERSTDPLLAVCTNGRRDVCCAVEGRPVADALAARADLREHVIEVSHIGGHRFAATALVLPTGDVFGRLDPAHAAEALLAAREGRLAPLEHHRGRSSLSRPAQAAEHAVRRAEGIDALDCLDVLRTVGDAAVPVPTRYEGEDGVADLQVRHRDGRAWAVHVTRGEGAARPESCGKPPAPVDLWTAADPLPLPRWWERRQAPRRP
jgi:hypothetical protein